MYLSESDLDAIWLTVKLATTVTILLLCIATPIAWWLARTSSKLKAPIAALLSLPLILPPTVLGFYLLIAMGPHGWIGQSTQFLGLGLLPFTFTGLVVASIIYSLPFAVYPIQNAIEKLGDRPLEVAATLGASPKDCFFSVVLPMIKPGLFTAAVLSFAHTVGEFGIVLMIGGNIPSETRVVAVQMYDHVEALEYAEAHTLAALMLGFSFVVLLLLYGVKRNSHVSHGAIGT